MAATEFTVVVGEEQVPELEPHAVVATLEEARASIPDGMRNIRRALSDDRAIAEVWL